MPRAGGDENEPGETRGSGAIQILYTPQAAQLYLAEQQVAGGLRRLIRLHQRASDEEGIDVA